MNRNFWTFIAVCAAGAFALVLLATWRSTPRVGEAPAAPMLLRVHEVPPAQADDIRAALATSLSMGEGQPPLGRVSDAGQGRLLVLAPESIQEDVTTSLAKLGGGRANPAIAPVVLDVWSIDALPGEGADDPSLAPVAEALAAARPALGAVRFVRTGAVSVAARTDGSLVRAETPQGFAIDAELRGADGGVTARLSMRDPQFLTTVDLRFDGFVVLSQFAAQEGRTRVLVARARPADARD